MCGWEPAQVTDHEYDDQNRLVRSVTRCEVEWDDRQRAWALALAYYEQSLCRRCGHSLHETLDPDTEGTMLASKAWVADEDQCFGCTALAAAEETRAKDEGKSAPLSAYIYTARLIPNPKYVGAKRG